MDLKKVYEAILNGKALLIFGSGMNYETLNSLNKPMPSGASLAKDLYNLANVDYPDNPNDLQDATDNYINTHSEKELISYLQKELSVGKPSHASQVIFSMPWIREYTTNYDNLPIIACQESVLPVTINEKPSLYMNKQRVCVYINGYLGNLSIETLKSSFKLSTNSYLAQENIMSSEWGDVLRQDMSRATRVIIIGLSLNYDLDLQRIIYENAREKVTIIEAPNINPNKKIKLGKFGKVYDIGINSFAKNLLDYKNNEYIPSNNCKRLINFKKGHSYNSCPPATGADLYNFFFWGKTTDSLFIRNRDMDSIISRTKLTRIIECVEEPSIFVVFLHANLGNGKTVFIDQLKRKLSDMGISNYEYKFESGAALAEDINILLNAEGQRVIIIENYFNHLGTIKMLSHYSLTNVTLILSARTMIYDTKLYEVSQMLSLEEGQSEIIEINKLDNRELNECVRIFEENKFWGSYSGRSISEKKATLVRKNKGNKEIHTILLTVIHSSEIGRRLNELSTSIRNVSGTYYRSIIIMLLSTVMSLEISINDIHDMLGIHCITDPGFRSNEAIKELVDFKDNGDKEFRIRSSIVALEILKKIDADEDIIKSLVIIANYSNQYCRVSEKYEGVLKNIVSFSHISTFLGRNRDNITFIMNYYDALKTISYYKDNSFFWLQYSIACMKYSDYKMAQCYIDASYDLFRKDALNVPFQCDNQQARLWLHMIRDGASDNIEKDFKNAHELAMKPCKSEKDREEMVIRLFQMYVDEKLVENIRQSGNLDLYKKCCGDAYNRVSLFLKSMRNLRDQERYVGLSKELLQCSTMIE